MVDQATQLIEEIQQIKAQYMAEVGKGRRVWPRSIKDRVTKLDELGVAVKSVAQQSGISYETLILWRYNRRHGIGKFHEVTVTPAARLSEGAIEHRCEISKAATVTVPNFEMPVSVAAPAVRLTMPNGFVIEGLDATGLALLIGKLSKPGGDHAF